MSVLTGASWRGFDAETQKRLLDAIQVRYNQAEKPTYTVCGPMRVLLKPSRVAPGIEGWISHPLKGDESLSPMAAAFNGGKGATLTLAPLDVSLLARGRQVRMLVEEAIDNLAGFPEHLMQVSERLDDQLLAEIQEATRAGEERAANEERERAAFLQSAAWGEF